MSLASMFSSPASQIPMPTNYLPYNPSQIDPTQAAMLGGIGGLSQYNLGGLNLGQAQGIGQGMINDPNAPGALSGAMTAAGLGTSAATNQFLGGGSLYGLGANIAQTSMDPQMALYNRMFAQNTDQARANAAAAGLGTTPIGASSVDWANQNFNINWQNAQLQRQIQGGEAAGQLGQMGAAMQGGAPALYAQSAMMPWQTGQQIGGANLGTLANLGQYGIQAAQLPGQQIAGWQGALGQMGALQGQSIQQQQTNAQLLLAQQQQAWNQQQQMMGGFGKVLGGIGGFAVGGLPGASIGSNVFGGGGGTQGPGWGGQNFAGMNSSPFGGLDPFGWGGAAPSGKLGGLY